MQLQQQEDERRESMMSDGTYVKNVPMMSCKIPLSIVRMTSYVCCLNLQLTFSFPNVKCCLHFQQTLKLHFISVFLHLTFLRSS